MCAVRRKGCARDGRGKKREVRKEDGPTPSEDRAEHGVRAARDAKHGEVSYVVVVEHGEHEDVANTGERAVRGDEETAALDPVRDV